MKASTQSAQPIGVIYSSAPIPPAAVEYAYYLYLVQAVFGSLFGISLPLIGGGTILALSGFCIWQTKSDLSQLMAPLNLLLGCLISHLVIQVVIHDEGISDSTSREII